MSTSTSSSYESVLTYLRTAEKQIDSTLDPFDCHTNYDNIADLQIYCDALSDHMCHELTRLAYESVDTTPEDIGSMSDSLVSIGSHCSRSAPLLTNSDNSLANTMSSSSSEHKSHKYVNHDNNDNIFELYCHRLSQYDNNDQMQTQLMSAKQLELLVSSSRPVAT